MDKELDIRVEPVTYPLDDAAITTIAELREQVKAAQIAMNAILNYFARQHDLKGQLMLADNGRELVLQPRQP